MHNVYVDTNIVVDMCDSKRALHEHSFAYISNYLKQEVCELFINSDTLANLFYVLSNRSTLNASEVLDKMHFVNEIFTVVPIESDDVSTALDLCGEAAMPYRDYEDAMQYTCAKKIDADVIVTNDKGFVSLDIELQKTSVNGIG